MKKDEKQSEKSVKKVSPKAVDFIWDKVVVLLCLLILALTVTYLVVGLLHQTNMQFYILNSIQTPPIVYFTVFLLVHALTIISPHCIWSLIFEKELKFFIELVKDLNWRRNLETGQYDKNDFDIVQKLEEVYCHTTIYLSYKMKLILQILFSVLSLTFMMFYFNSDFFLSSFPCPSVHNITLPEDWPLNTTIHCIPPSLHYLSIIRYVDMTFVSIVIAFLCCGLFWCGLKPASELNRKHIAQFVVSSCLVAEDYDPKPFSPRVTNDMEFLLTRLYPADTGYRNVFQDIQIQREINQLYKEHKELLKLFLYSIGEGKLILTTSMPSRVHNEEEHVTSGTHFPGGNLSVYLNLE